MNQQHYRKLISGQKHGPATVILCLFLRSAAWLYSIVIGLRNFLYSKKWLKIHSADVPVISVGNITVGGTGKTPLVIWLYNKITSNYKCAILTRGYKTHTEKRASSIEHRVSRIDEPAILNESCPDAKVIVNPNRVAGAIEAVNKFGAKALIMDDGFQHRRLARDIDIVTIDATCPFGYGKMLPAGLLREPISALKRADAVVITRCDQTGEAKLDRIKEELQSNNPNMIIARSVHKPICAKFIDGKEIGLKELNNKKVFAFCGIGNPNAFFNTITKLGAKLAGSRIFDDHHHYTNSDIGNMYKQAEELKADLILTTQKDFSKFKIQNSKFKIQLAYLAIELKFVSGEDKITRLIKNALAGKITKVKSEK